MKGMKKGTCGHDYGVPQRKALAMGKGAPKKDSGKVKK